MIGVSLQVISTVSMTSSDLPQLSDLHGSPTCGSDGAIFQKFIIS